MTDTLSFNDESLERSVRRRATYDDSEPGDLMLSVAKRAGGTIKLPLLLGARSNIEQEVHQENTLLRIKPLAEIASNLPVQSGGLTFHTGRGVALLRPGFLYVFRGDTLWRELEIDAKGLMSDIDLPSLRKAQTGSKQSGSVPRKSEGEWLSDFLVPVLLQGRAVINEIRIAYSEVQWDWSYVRHLEGDAAARRARTSAIDHAWPAASVDELRFDKGYPASNIKHVDDLRPRDLGVELMLANPSDFSPAFEAPGDDELCSRLNRRLAQIAGDEAQDTVGMDLKVEPETDSLAEIRDQAGLVCVSIPDPLFSLRHSLAQLHLALHYLDAVDESIQENPMVHSAMLIRQAVFDPLALNGESRLQKYADVIDREKLDHVLETGEKQAAIKIIDRHVAQLKTWMHSPLLAAVLDDYRRCSDLAICEGYLLIADKLTVLQQVPGVMRANGVAPDDELLSSLKRWILDSEFLTAWAPQPEGGNDERGAWPSHFQTLHRLIKDQTEITEDQLDRLNLQSLAYLERQLKAREDSEQSIAKGISDGGKVSAMVARSLEEWSTAVLTVCKRLIEEGEVRQVEIQRVMQAAVSNFVLADPDLEGIHIVSRGGVDSSGTILGVQGAGLQRGLTDFDRTEGVLTRKNDYLYADLMNGQGELKGSTSPARASDELEATLQKMAGPALVFYAPAGHPEAAKLSLLKVDFAKRVGAIVDGPAVSRGLVVLAAFNVFSEIRNVLDASRAPNSSMPYATTKLVAGAFAELFAASLKLSIVMKAHNSGGHLVNATHKLAIRPWFDLKNWFFVGARLQKLGAQTLVRTVGLAGFIAGAAGVAFSYWDMRLMLHNKDFDSAAGHGVAMAGGIIFLSSPLMHTLLAIPGWGWAAFGMAMVVGGSMYAVFSSDDSFEKLLKRGPLGNYPDQDSEGFQDKAYFSQLLTLLSPISVTAQTYAEVEPDPDLAHPDYDPSPEDYVITIRTPVTSRLRLFREQRAGLSETPFNLVVQELAYTSSKMDTFGPVGAVENSRLRATTPLRKVMARQSLPAQSAVRFLVKRELKDEVYETFGYREDVSTSVRVGVQAILDTEIGPSVFPTPLLENYEPFDLARHGFPPEKSRSILDPYSQPASPYWFFTEVST